MKPKGDDAALAHLERIKEQLSKDEERTQVTRELKRKPKTSQPEPEKLKELKASIERKIEKPTPMTSRPPSGRRRMSRK